MKAKRMIGMKEIQSDPVRLATWPNFSTTNWPKKFESVPPRPKQEAVTPTEKHAEDNVSA